MRERSAQRFNCIDVFNFSQLLSARWAVCVSTLSGERRLARTLKANRPGDQQLQQVDPELRSFLGKYPLEGSRQGDSYPLLNRNNREHTMARSRSSNCSTAEASG